MTKGEHRVGISFNPSGISEVDRVKQITASLIDEMEGVIRMGDNPEAARCAAIAQTKYEEACMWAVKAITKPSTFMDRGGEMQFKDPNVPN
jgi:hypothetical protein